MRTRLNERDLNRIVRRVINEGKIVTQLSRYVNDAKMTEGQPMTLTDDAGTKFNLKRVGDQLVITSIETSSKIYILKDDQ